MKPETQQLAAWFCQRVRVEPEFLEHSFFPAVERMLSRADLEFHQAARADDLSQIKYRQGRLDGAHEIMSLMGGLRFNEAEKPAEPGLVARISRFGRTNNNA